MVLSFSYQDEKYHFKYLPFKYCKNHFLRQTETNVEGPDENGEICIKSPQCFKGYLNTDHKKTFDSDGFFHTGDLGYYDNQVKKKNYI